MPDKIIKVPQSNTIPSQKWTPDKHAVASFLAFKLGEYSIAPFKGTGYITIKRKSMAENDTEEVVVPVERAHCPQCDSINLRHVEGCDVCPDCGWSACDII